jgi:hypothetical protein
MGLVWAPVGERRTATATDWAGRVGQTSCDGYRELCTWLLQHSDKAFHYLIGSLQEVAGIFALYCWEKHSG